MNAWRKAFGPMLVAGAVAALLAPAGGAGATDPANGPLPEVAMRRTIGATAETSVTEVHPTETGGAAPRLTVDGAPRRVTFLRFAVPATEGRLRSAVLRLHVSDAPRAGSSTTGGTVLTSSVTTWDEATTSWTTRPPLDGRSAGSIGPAPRNTWVERDVSALVRPGQVITLGIRSMARDDVVYDAGGSGFGPRLALDVDAPPDGVIVDAAGDLVCGAGRVVTPDTCHDQQVSDLVVADAEAAAFLALGDLQYTTGALADFQTYYDPTYGRVLPITRPVIGNHKYQTPDGDGYWDYFGSRAGPRDQGWYSFDLGSRWHLIALNSNCTEVSCANGSPQLQWLRADLLANRRPCVAAFFHHPRWSSGKAPGNNPSVDPFIRLLQRHRAELVISGHSHNYERFGRQRADGTPAANGIRQFVVGTGGRSVDEANGFDRPLSANSQFRLAHVFGLLRLSLTNSGFWWSFVDENGRVRDSGTDACH